MEPDQYATGDAVMGKTIVKAKLTNLGDIFATDRGFITADQVRSIEVEGIVDTGATLVSLPSHLVETLGLTIVEYHSVRYADGRTATRPIATGLRIEIQGRTAEGRCIVNETESTVLIGQLPLEEMDWMVHPRKQCLVPVHEGFEGGLIEMY